MTESDAELRAEFAEMQRTAHQVIRTLLRAHAQQNGAAGAFVAKQVYGAGEDFLMAVLGQFTITLAEALDAVPRETEPNPAEIDWWAAVHDQVNAAVDHKDGNALAQIVVDGQLRALREDQADPELTVDLPHILKATTMLPHETAALVAAEALRRLLSG